MSRSDRFSQDMSPSILSAQYQNIAVTPEQVANVRGSGMFSSDYPLSSNWPVSETKNQFDSYIENTTTFPSYGKKWDLSNSKPVGYKENFQWEIKESDKLEDDPFFQFGLRANQTTATALNSLFFNKTNVKYLQNRIIDDVYKLTQVRIKPQREDALLVVMNNKYQYSLYGWLPAASTVHLALPRGEKPCSLNDRLVKLNQAVLQDIIQQILSGMSMYIQYYKDASSLPTPLSLPTLTTMKGSKALSENIGMQSGNSSSLSSFNQRYNIVN